MQGRLRAVVPRAVDARGRRDVLEYLVFGPGRGGRALVVDEPGEQPAAPALHLRVHAAPRRRVADHRVRLEMAEPLPGSDRLGPVRDGHAHRDARPLRLPALFPRPAFPAARQVLAQARRPLRFGVDPLVEALVADAHGGVVRVHGLQPALDQFRAPPPAQRVKHPGAQRARVHAARLAGSAPAQVRLPLHGQRRMERTRGPCPGLQPFRPVGAIRPVLVGREPQAAPQLAAHGGLVPADPLRGPPDARMLFAMQLLDQDPLLGRQVRILSAHECNTFLS